MGNKLPPRICVVGSSNMDLIATAPHLPAAGETVMGTSFQTVCGGKGGNQAVMAARLGARVSLVSRLGKDAFGEMLLDNYQKEGIDTRHVHVDPKNPTGVASILVGQNGENCIVLAPGANAVLSKDEVYNAAQIIGEADCLLCQLEVPMDVTGEALNIANSFGKWTFLNPAPYQPFPSEWNDWIKFLILNETELGQMTGSPTATSEEIEAAARRLHDRFGWSVVVTLGSRGVFYQFDRPHWAPAIPVEAVDTTGAGDAFVAALAVERAGNASMIRCLERANALAAFTVTRPGTQSSYPTRREALAVLRAQGLTRRE